MPASCSAGPSASAPRWCRNWPKDAALVIGANEPYRIELEYDYTVPVHGDARGRDAVLLEVRQDLLGDAAGCAAWAARIATALDAAMR